MSINLYNPRLKEFVKILGWILLFIFLWFNSCSKEHAIKKIVTPEVVGTFEKIKPDHEPIENSSINHVKKDGLVYIENPLNAKLLQENEKLKADFDCANDSLKKLAYYKSIEVNKFATKFEDQNIIINLKGMVRGEIQEVVPDYIWKEKSFDVAIKPKEDKFKVLGGLEIGNNTKLDNFNLKANLILQNQTGNIFSFSRDTKKNYYVGYSTVLF